MPTAYAAASGRRSGGSGDLRHGNLTHILSYVRDNGPCSRHDIAAGCGLGVSTLTDLISELRSRRLVRELDPIRRPGAGRPTRPISLDGEPWCVLGVHIDVNAIEVIASTLGGRELWTERHDIELSDDTERNTFAAVAQVLTTQVQRLPEETELVSVEVGVPGYVEGDRGLVVWSKPLNWQEMPLADLVRECLASAGVAGDVHVGIGNEGQYAALFAGRDEIDLATDAVVLYLGGARTLSTGVLIDGHIFEGSHGGAGALGHHRVDADSDLCWCGRPDCVQGVASPLALLVRSGLLGRDEAEALIQTDPRGAIERVRLAADSGDERVLAALAEAGDALGQVVDDAFGILNPHAAVLGGYLGHLEAFVMPSLLERIAPRMSYLTYEATQVLTLPMCELRVVKGAALAARDAGLAEPLRLTRLVA